MTTPLSKSLTPHIYGIDLVRFACALAVAVFHWNWRYSDGAGLALWGWVGVEIFFVISGIVIAASASGSTLARFAEGRFLRLYPAAWVCGAISVAVLLAFPANLLDLGIKSEASRLRVAGSIILYAPWHISSAYWTLPIELTFYAVVAAFVSVGGGRWLPLVPRLLTLLSCIFFALLAIEQVSGIKPPLYDFAYEQRHKLLLEHGCFFALGMYMSRAYDKKGIPLAAMDKVLAGIAALLGVYAIVNRAHELAPKTISGTTGMPGADPVGLALAAVLVFIGAVAFIVASMQWNHLVKLRPFGQRLVRMMGLITYPLYLLHEAIGGTFIYHLRSTEMSYGLLCGLALVLVIAVSWAAVRIEAPVRELIKSLLQHVAYPVIAKARTYVKRST